MGAAEKLDARVPDAALVAATLAGDEAAFRSLYERYAPAVLGFLAARLVDHAAAEDALQEAFLKAYRALATWDPGRPFGPWIAAIAENVAHDHGRRVRRSRLQGGLADDAVSPGEDASRIASRREREEALGEALAGLAPEARRVLLLRYRAGLTQREVAEQLGCSVRTAQTREAEALAALATRLDARRKDAP